jgi:type IV pilus assembly protein PilC
MRGEGLARPLGDSGLFPGSARQMFRVGEDTGTLDDQLHTAAIYFERELDYKIKRFTSLFEPAILVFVGLVVGFVAIALVSAMYGVFGQANKV